MSNQSEEWRPVVGFEGYYEVSSDGRVRSVTRIVRNPNSNSGIRQISGKVISHSINRRGYFSVRLFRNSSGKRQEIHRLVGNAFIGPLPKGHHTHHIDEDKTNNRLDNLEYRPMGKHMHLHHRGENAHKAVLTDVEVLEIQALLADNQSHGALAKRYGVDHATISHIKHGRSWAWLTGVERPTNQVEYLCGWREGMHVEDTLDYADDIEEREFIRHGGS